MIVAGDVLTYFQPISPHVINLPNCKRLSRFLYTDLLQGWFQRDY